MKLSKLAAGAAVVSSLAVTALAHGGATGVVKERMDGMGVMKESMKVLTPMMQGKTPYDADVIREEAKKIAAHSGEAMTKLFPEGSTDKPSEAKSEIWSQWEDFSNLAAQLEALSEGLALAAENGLMMAGSGQGNLLGGSSMMGSGTGMMGSGMMGSGMMGSGMMGNAPMMEPSALAQMPADGVFTMLGQACSACHTRFRAE
ncbi:c-type cytochrome [Actibacterium pelagium]|uniref:Cytochrome c556 n=1 Tax=Actibacterium pelagium TaxID=2029103 RepID=A0A917EPH7_9RHOB|nr:cytochrome c [Actibacterium pelagium]GGE62761.1 hypothetical protein GCM10011517_33120 [Actibacterium pelagium]